MDVNTLKSRWLTPDGRDKKDRILRILAKGKSLNDRLVRFVELTDDGLIDLRGLVFDKGIRYKGVSFQGIDLSYSSFNSCRFEKCTFQRCRLCYADMGWNERRCHFVEVDFTGASFRDAAVGIGCSIYRKVDFTNADFSGTLFYCPQYKGCNFSNARLRGVDFNAANFIDCRFTGRIEDVWFRKYYPLKGDEKRFGRAKPNEMKKVDFSEAELWRVTFSGGLDLSNVILPKDGNHILFKQLDKALVNVKELIYSSIWSDEQRKKMEITINSFLVHAQGQPMWIVNKNEIIDELGEEVGKEFIELLERFDSQET